MRNHNLEMKHLPGADPELVLLSHRYVELEVRGQWRAGRCHRA
nr:PREDICTED: selenoprotein M-like [Struthio camelus australis]